GLALLRAGDVTRWDAAIHLARADGAEVAAAAFIARIPNAAAGGASLLVQLADISARSRADQLRDCAGAVRQIIVTAVGLEGALPQLLGAFCDQLDWDVAQYWSPDADGQSMRARQASTVSDAPLEGFLHASRGLGVRSGAGLIGRVWRSGVVAAEEDIELNADYDRMVAAHSAGLRSVVAFAVIDGGEVIGVIELASEKVRSLQDDEVTMLVTAGVEIGQFIRRTETAQALRRSEADHRAIYERSPIGIARISSGGEILEANPALLLMLEHDEETMRASAWPDLLRAYDQAAARQHKAPFLAGISDGGLEPDEVRAYGGYIFNDAERVNRLIGDMLDLDRMESGRMSMRATDVDVNDLLMEAISRAAPSAVSVEFKSDLDPRLPVVTGDRDRLIQVISKLLNNAVKYSPEGGTVTLSSRVEGQFGLVSVSDTGIGIPQDEISHVFERFRRVRSGAAQSIPGTGLGLTIVKQIVEMHGGKIW